MTSPSGISVIVPAHNAASTLPLCLEAISRSAHEPCEVIVVDDGSSDETAEIARRAGAVVLATGRASGPGNARNLAARHARGDLLLFVDSDVLVENDTIGLVADRFREEPSIAALFGSYDESPAEQNFLSQYKNLQHHYVHQQSRVDAATFWAGLGAVRTSVFLDVGGFDAERYARPSIEDIELGQRLTERGHRVVLDKRIRAKHLKKWTFWALVRTEIFCRAVPWTELILEKATLPADLNLSLAARASALLTLALIPLVVFSFVWNAAVVASLVAFATIVALNLGFYRFLASRRGVFFAIRAIPMHLLYFAYSAITFIVCRVRFAMRSGAKQRAS